MSQFNPAVNNTVGEKFVARYVHTGNQEIYINTVDWATATFTTPTPHGINTGTAVSVLLTPNYYDISNPQRDLLSIPMEWIKPQGGANSPTYGVSLLAVDETTLKVVRGNDNTTPITVNPTSLENNNNLDYTKFHFEVCVGFVIDGLPMLKKFRLKSYGYTKPYQSNQQYRYIKIAYTAEDGSTNQEGSYLQLLGFNMTSNPQAAAAVHTVQDWVIDATMGYQILAMIEGYHGGRRNGFNTLIYDRFKEQYTNTAPIFISGHTKKIIGITKLYTYTAQYAYMANGTVIEFYDLGGF
jgi:hypothetical protein